MTRSLTELSGPRQQGRHHLLLACFPKSGSTFLASILANLPGFRKVSLVPDYERREQELSLDLLAAADRTCPRFVAQHHVRYSRETTRLMELFSLRPIVLVRNIYDVVVSIRDHIRREGTVIAQAFIPPDAPQWENQRLERFIADMIIPWYFNFYAAWSECPNRVNLTYEELTASPLASVRRIRDELRMETSDAELDAAVEVARLDRASTRFNTGVCGRGKGLAPSAVSRIREMAGYYAALDLSPIGLPSKGAAGLAAC